MVWALFFFFSLFSWVWQPLAVADLNWPDGQYKVRGDIFTLDGPIPNEKVFRFEKTIHKKGKRLQTIAVYRTLDGKDACRETGLMIEGRLKAYSHQEYQARKFGTVEARYPEDRHPELTFELDVQGKSSQKDVDSVSDLPASSATLAETLFSNWDYLMKGFVLDVSVIVIDELEAYTFKIRRAPRSEDLREKAGEEIFTIKPNNLLISALISPVQVRMKLKPTPRVLEVTGQMPVKLFRNGKLVEFNGRLVLKPPQYTPF